MSLSMMEAHLACVTLAAIDIGARSFRLRRILSALGCRLPFLRLLAITLTCDAACAVTPHRAGGEPARAAGMLHAGVPSRSALLAIASETVLTWPVIFLYGMTLAWRFGGSWWGGFVLGFTELASRARLALILALFGMPLAWWMGARALRLLRSSGLASVRLMRRDRRLLSMRLLLATAPLTLVAVSARVLILPVLMSTLPGPPSLGQTAMGSFMLLHSQLLLPVPAGAGVVDVGLLSELHGNANAGVLLLLWRTYVSGIGVLLGTAAAIMTYGGSLIASVRRCRDHLLAATSGSAHRRRRRSARRACVDQPEQTT